MTLRFRLVVGLGLLLAVGLGMFGAGTYAVYRSSQYQRLDDQLRSNSAPIVRTLLEDAGLSQDPGPGGGGDGGGDDRQGPQFFVPVGWYAELRSADGEILSQADATVVPDLPDDLSAADPYFTTGSDGGGPSWRIHLVDVREQSGAVGVIAVPTTEVENSLGRLVLIEGLAGGVLILVLIAGSWFVLRRGLRPLEHMAGSARQISAGDLTQRVSPADGRTEVGQLGLALNTMLDEIEAAFRQRTETENKLRQFLADASHELRTPLTSIQGFAELFRLGVTTDQIDQATMVRRIEEESARMRRLVEDLLLLARLDQTRPVQSEAVDLTVLAADACTDAAAVAGDRTVSLDAPEPVVVAGDRDHLRQAIANLVTNALKHTAPGTPVEVSARLHGTAAVLAVRDHGGGLDAEALEHVFDRFWQADRARVGTGVGLGLSIVAAIAQEHGGSVRASNHRDGGALFEVMLPVAGPRAVTSAAE